MHRRAFLRSSLAFGGLVIYKLQAQNCTLVGSGVIGCEIKLPFPTVLLSATLQQCPEWCWAASLSMVFKFFGHPLDQKKIVMAAYNGLTCQAANNSQIADDLSSSWTDDKGNDFTSAITAAYDVRAGRNTINNSIIVNELRNGRPLLYCNSHHAMVVCAIDYRTNGGNIVVDKLWVMDPWPYPGVLTAVQTVHALSPAEMVPAHLGGQLNFLASVTVS